MKSTQDRPNTPLHATRRSALTTLAAGASVLALERHAAAGPKPKWRELWNKRSLAGWETFLRPAAKDAPPIGLGADPHGVFSIVKHDGRPAIRISGQDWGAMTTKEEFGDYHFRVWFKWGEKRWPPRESAKRDSGILYHCVGPHGAGSGAWMRSFESQVQEGDCGDFHSVDGVLVDVEAVPAPAKNTLLYKPGVPVVVGNRNRIIKHGDHERPNTEWNLMEVLAVGQTAVHLVNGKQVMVLGNLRHQVGDREVPLTRGKIQIQSEGAEVFYRAPQIAPLSKLPPGIG
jgi:hypothetical protein